VCGGDGTCGKCKVAVLSGDVDAPPAPALSEADRAAGLVLACQAQVRGDVSVAVPQDHALDTGSIVADASSERVRGFPGEEGPGALPWNPLVRKVLLSLTPPTDEDQLADADRLSLALRHQGLADAAEMDLATLHRLPAVLAEGGYAVTVTLARRGCAAEVVDIEPGDTTAHDYAVAVDVGTTTVVAHLVDLASRTTLGAASAYNSQMHFGDDYIRRIIYAEQNDAFGEMQRRIVEDISGLIRTLAQRHGVDAGRIGAVVAAGNTAMIHFLLGLDARRIRRAPYVPSAAHIPPQRAADVGLPIHPRGWLYALPAVGAYVGGDIVAGVLATRLHEHDGLAMLIDIGTNGEVVLGSSEWMVCASSSAGPAFEGSGVRHGMRAAAGAIERVVATETGALRCQTIGGEPPRGICGTGLLDALAALYETGLIDRTGRLAADDPRVEDGPEGAEFVLVSATPEREALVITQADIANLVRSKAGVYAAIQILMETTDTVADALDAVYVAGGFGNMLDVRKAIRIGMLPDIDPARVHFVGNTSIAGAKMAALSAEALAAAEAIASRMTYFDLMHHPHYMDAFMQANFLPHTDLDRFPSVRLAQEHGPGRRTQ
jgi:uncharacterized 2Fe-2S/4Fe-4S cluster protein (DUF4445 family)